MPRFLHSDYCLTDITDSVQGIWQKNVTMGQSLVLMQIKLILFLPHEDTPCCLQTNSRSHWISLLRLTWMSSHSNVKPKWLNHWNIKVNLLLLTLSTMRSFDSWFYFLVMLRKTPFIGSEVFVKTPKSSRNRDRRWYAAPLLYHRHSVPPHHDEWTVPHWTFCRDNLKNIHL